MITLDQSMPFEDAIKARAIKQLLPTNLTSAEIQTLSRELRRRAAFSATVTDAGFIQKFNDLVTKIAGGPNDADFAARLAGEKPLLTSIPDAKAQLLQYLKDTGYAPGIGEAGTIKDLTSDARLQLIVETNVLDAQGFGRWKSGQNKVALSVNPAWELVRMRYSKVPRDWPERWQAALDDCGQDDGATDGSDRMVALKNHPIWQALGDGAGGYEDTLGNPWPPFAFNSGMGVIDVSRDDAVELELLDEDEEVEPAEDDLGLNDNVEASVANFGHALQGALARGFNLVDGVLSLNCAPANFDGLRNRLSTINSHLSTFRRAA